MAEVCPVPYVLFAASTLAYTAYLNSKKKTSEKNTSSSTTKPMFQVVFVLGGPGAGKGTQCTLLSNSSNWSHLSAGDLLRAERKSGSDLANLINDYITNGQIVPAKITVDLLKAAMEKAYAENSDNTKFLIDGFPRSEDNVNVWNETMTSDCTKLEFILFLDCPEDVMTGRLLERGKTSGRNDDELDVIKKRFETFRKESMPIVEMYEKTDANIVKYVTADRSQEDVFKEVEQLFVGL